ncbi:HDOD domain-containing protein [Mitsuaria sp. GD03876]|uniref:HDOD domain-containing protein n=1 Tax=Mitsuaria sp. GD03876 TaxID=2975399 RepID=UPI00244AE91A|nr:HDOD domain-containing protein [Mitsuaria sp. GD03876]MDH0864573.1 HDOD domain-containing protein [Mitsuaria sp. GD03876]
MTIARMTPVTPVSSSAERFFGGHASLPVMPEVGRKLLRSLDDDGVSLGQIAELIGKDSTLAAKVLRLANSARYSPSHSIGTLQDAAMALGLETLRNLAMAASISASFPEVKGLDRQRFWRHSVRTAGYARLLATLLRGDTDTAYLAGLMLRTGQLMMAMSEAAQVADVEAHAAEPGSRFSLEMHRFGCTHADVTAALAEHWHFPADLVEAFKDANAPLEVRPFSMLAAILHLAEVIADACDAGLDRIEALTLAVPELVEHVRLDLEFLRVRLDGCGDPGQDVELMLK